ncbi:MAG: amidohydrolase family protein [Planctomycetes bacterium]|nr:amidohydrolase family protein [Planctomycetota bacterium]
MPVWVLVLGLVLGATTALPAQLPFGSNATAFKGATVYLDGKPVENCWLIVSGKKIKAVGTDVEVPEGAEIVDLGGKVVIPALIDASADLGLLAKASAGRRARRGIERPHFDVLDELDPFNLDPFTDSLAGGVAYAYLRNEGAQGIGGRGAGILVPAEKSPDLPGLRLDGVEALHVRLGIGDGPVARYLEVEAFGKQLEAADKYRESWKKYREEKDKYEKELAKLPKEGKKAEAKKGDDKKKPGAIEAPVGDDHDLRPDGFGEGDPDGPAEVTRLPVPAPWDVWALGDPDRAPLAVVRRERAEATNHEPEFPTRWDTGRARLRPSASFIGDGTEPQLLPEAERREDDPSGVAIFVCAHCGGEIEGQPHHHDEPRGFDFWEFAPEDGKKPDAKAAEAKKDDKGPKKPAEPRFDPVMEQLVRVIEGKLPVRIEVHRAADIRNLLALIERRPMRVVLEGATEAWMVADEIARAEIPVLLFGDLVAPPQEDGRRQAAIDLPPGLPPELIEMIMRRQAPQQAAAPDDGLAVADLAARLDRAGVTVVIAASREASDVSGELLLAAARACGQGLDRAVALRAVTSMPARILGLDDLGELERGRRASFVVLDGDPLATGTRLQAIYVDGKTHYEKK